MTVKVFENGRSQAVRLPKECRFRTDEVAVKVKIENWPPYSGTSTQAQKPGSGW